MRFLLLLIIFFNLCTNIFAADSIVVYSPDKKISVSVHYKDKITYTINYGDETILQPSMIDIILENGLRLSNDLYLQKESIASFNEK
jgi:hypothetical protein